MSVGPGSDVGAAAPHVMHRHRFANAEFDESQNLLRVDGQTVVVEPKPLQLLVELLRRVNEVVTREELRESLWDNRVPIDSVLPNAVSKLRKALGDAASAHIVNIPRIGYRLLGPVERIVVGQLEEVALNLAPGQAVLGRDGYRLVQPLGAAGRRHVWLARHAKLCEERVFKFATDADGLRSLKREFTLYRLLKAELGDEPGFALVIDSNFSEAPYHLECKYGGPDLLTWAVEDERLHRMSTADRLSLFIRVAQAVAAAHGVGVLHKDLKPANVLVGGEPGAWRPVLTDFGSGHAIDPQRLRALGLTAMGLTLTKGPGDDTTLGTAMYLAPEVQAGQASTVQSDVYALGLILYQLLAGDMRRPLSTGWQRDIDDELLVEDITAATEGQPQARLRSAADLVDRLTKLDQRHAERARQRENALREQALLAEQRRLRARRPWRLAALGALLLGLGVSVVLGLQTRQALQLSQQSATRSSAINAFMTHDFFSGIDVVRAGPDATVSMREVLERASARAATRFKSQALTEAELRGQIAVAYGRLSLLTESVAEFRRALALLDAPPAGASAAVAVPSAEAAALVVKLRLNLASALAMGHQLPEARALLEAVERVSPGPDQQVDPERAFALARAQYVVNAMGQRLPAAVEPGARMVSLADALPPEQRSERFGARFMYGDLLYRLGQPEKAAPLFAALLQPPFDAQSIGAINLARTRIALARVQHALDKTAPIESTLIEARDLLQQRLGLSEYYVSVANSELAQVHENRGDFAKAAHAFRDAHAGYVEHQGAHSPAARITEMNLALVEISAGQPAAALQRLDAGRPWFVEKLGGEQGAVVQAIDFDRARALTLTGRPALALALLGPLKPEVLVNATPGRDWPWRLQAERARAQIGLGQVALGLPMLRAAVDQMDAAGTSAWVKADYVKSIEAASRGGKSPAR